ncbi:hypothetical protein CLV35_0211 [Motilibacter peucedani]|uniref:Uncharacterized protein n=1 Tax=Motilibacter peucedani TaxID=598650 RepID=A0A420XUS8_9ACTN|nr:hypothetical protein [Motilibacter peucedani]RKS80622.1 hypothetical protein CLV35_0211 [Motilibacter peucedani]
MARELKERVNRPAAQVRAAFLDQNDPNGPPPPMAQLVRGGRGGEVKLKIALSLLWVAVGEPHDVVAAARAWAMLIGLPDPGGRGAQRVNAAIRQLAKLKLIKVEAKVGGPPRILLLEDSASGLPYTLPGQRIVELKQKGDDFGRHRYFKVPSELWTQGWIATLGGPALAMLLILLSRASGRQQEAIWFSPGIADAHYRLSEETRRRGLDSLRALGLVTVSRRPLTTSLLAAPRRRNVYTLREDVLFDTAPSVKRDV